MGRRGCASVQIRGESGRRVLPKTCDDDDDEDDDDDDATKEGSSGGKEDDGEG